ncbi:nuclear distribution protein RO10 [Histoplasma capsulatum]|uniref:Nuclear distribution protein RO10 n=1 Tax=Ajellomyces capsulatus TaxID=5037 RepID=A0A8A1LX32_AJECA|nr:nuclear distribution protein RO10 [Histoplasma capsulatum]
MAKPISTSTPTSMPTSVETAADTIELLESRLRRIEYLLSGESSWTGEPRRLTTATGVGDGEKPAMTQLAKLEYELKVLANKVPAVRDVLALCILPLPRPLPINPPHHHHHLFVFLFLTPTPGNPQHALPASPNFHNPLLRLCLPRNCLPPNLPQRPAHPARVPLGITDRATATSGPIGSGAGTAGSGDSGAASA